MEEEEEEEGRIGHRCFHGASKTPPPSPRNGYEILVRRAELPAGGTPSKGSG